MVLRFPLALVLVLPLWVGCGGESERVEVATAPDAAIPEAAPEPETAAEPALTFDASTTVGAVVAKRPETARLFELVGIDYCCGGALTLTQAAQESDLDVQRLLDVLAVMTTTSSGESQRDWTQVPLDELMDHIVDTHHVYLRRELPRLTEIVATVRRVHADTHPELIEVEEIYTALRKGIGPHLEEEETKLFPAIRARASTDAAALKTLLESMRTDHDDVGQALHRLRELTNGYARPDDACAKYEQMLKGLAGLERDLHTHVHLENEVLLPRALAALKGS